MRLWSKPSGTLRPYLSAERRDHKRHLVGLQLGIRKFSQSAQPQHARNCLIVFCDQKLSHWIQMQDSEFDLCEPRQVIESEIHRLKETLEHYQTLYIGLMLHGMVERYHQSEIHCYDDRIVQLKRFHHTFEIASVGR